MSPHLQETELGEWQEHWWGGQRQLRSSSSHRKQMEKATRSSEEAQGSPCSNPEAHRGSGHCAY